MMPSNASDEIAQQIILVAIFTDTLSPVRYHICFRAIKSVIHIDDSKNAKYLALSQKRGSCVFDANVISNSKYVLENGK